MLIPGISFAHRFRSQVLTVFKGSDHERLGDIALLAATNAGISISRLSKSVETHVNHPP